MSRTIAVKDSDGNDGYVVVEVKPVHHRSLSGRKVDGPGTISFYLPTGQVINHVSEELFENPMTEETYYVVNDEDVEWLLSIRPSNAEKIRQ